MKDKNKINLAVTILILSLTVFVFGVSASEIEISGVGSVSFRSTKYSTETSSLKNMDGFQLEHFHLKFFKDLSDKLSVTLMPCMSHMETLSLIEAKFDYEVKENYILTMGRFLVPFGQFNYRSYPDGFNTVSRPLLYQGHEDGFINVDNNNPKPLFFTQQTDVGIMLASSLWFGDDEDKQLWYGFYVINGLQGNNDINSLDMMRKWRDNNKSQTYGGRLSFTFPAGEKVSMSLGASAQSGKYDSDDNLKYNSSSADIECSAQTGGESKFVLRGEYANSPREVKYGELNNSANELVRESTLSGYYVNLEYAINKCFEIVGQYDQLQREQPLLYGANLDRFDISKLTDIKTEIKRSSIGLNYSPDNIIKYKLEYSKWDLGNNADDASRISLQAVAAF